MLITLFYEFKGISWERDAFVDLLLGLGVYVGLLFFLAILGKIGRDLKEGARSCLLFFAHLSLFLFFIIYHGFFSSHRFYVDSSFVWGSQFFFSICSLIYYFFALWVFYSFFYSARRGVAPLWYKTFAWKKICFLFPFVVPFLIFSLFLDISKLNTITSLWQAYFSDLDPFIEEAVVLALTVIFLFLNLLYFPVVLQYLWACEPLERESRELKDRLECLSKRANFKHAGLKVWTVMGSALTAAVVGIVPRFRYVMFTKSLIRKLPLEQVEAVFAHEMGHIYHRHLLFYPFLVVGIFIVQSLFSMIFEPTINHIFSLLYLYDQAYFRFFSPPIVIFIIYGTIFLIYFRLFYGFFSRNFERQADLHVCHLNISVEHMIEALNSVAIYSGNTHRRPCWHHYSIQKRMDFLQEVQIDPRRVQSHHRKVRRWRYLFISLLLLSLSVLFSVKVEKYPVFSFVYQTVSKVREESKEKLSFPFRRKLARKYWKLYQLQGDSKIIQESLMESFSQYAGDSIPGVAEFYAAQNLLRRQELLASASLMEKAWQRFDFSEAESSVLEDFVALTQEVVESFVEEVGKKEEVEQLLETMSVSLEKLHRE